MPPQMSPSQLLHVTVSARKPASGPGTASSGMQTESNTVADNYRASKQSSDSVPKTTGLSNAQALGDSSQMAPAPQEVSQSRSAAALQQTLLADSDVAAQYSDGSLASMQDGAAVISPVHVDAIVLSFNTWSQLMQEAGQVSCSQTRTSPAVTASSIFLLSEPPVICPAPLAGPKLNPEPAAGQQDQRAISEPPSGLAQPLSAPEDHHMMGLLIIAAASFSLGALAHGCSRHLAAPCKGIQSETQGKRPAITARSHKDQGSLAKRMPSSSACDLATPGGSGTGSQHVSGTTINAQALLACTPGRTIMPLQDVLADSACSPGAIGRPGQSPSWGSLHSSDVQAQGSRQPRQSTMRRQSSIWARTNDGRLRKVVAPEDEEEHIDKA